VRRAAVIGLCVGAWLMSWTDRPTSVLLQRLFGATCSLAELQLCTFRFELHISPHSLMLIYYNERLSFTAGCFIHYD